MTQIFGEFNEILSPSQEYLILHFSPSSIPLKQRWRNNGLSADFMAYYFMTFFPGSEDEHHTNRKQAEIKGAVSYIANELLENAMKFNDETSLYPISISLHLHQEKLIFLTTNSIAREKVSNFQAYIQQLITSDTEELYISQLEKNAEDETCTVSGLGILTMINDYLATIGWKFETVEEQPQIITVTTMVQLTI
ncbi:MAG TPA: ATP-binding protein [Cyanobacteria bacterium UBA11149]|nr:ATP-binding protein [Cyanobacteria bacterium UBA11367]HBE55969.1 ATP-binding protein [Cyanobacteria bacterium UBA11366]HBK63197.1 ATP-binding protein [Cyanobacteria bacterium UBA11166]HBR74753.1 ATP-binding protein [Cyanobacteria bacterium UBA11159]HBS72524.1 ATP-binding protein [Cyanobacteria bacterium UBA11153]HBW88689.1 ATP-binding protein [Cyanobacteria bacterium UBA11149]HCA94505.1 ATP-binding protein [Cyanobacteria bacterium UBA9226]